MYWIYKIFFLRLTDLLNVKKPGGFLMLLPTISTLLSIKKRKNYKKDSQKVFLYTMKKRLRIIIEAILVIIIVSYMVNSKAIL